MICFIEPSFPLYNSDYIVKYPAGCTLSFGMLTSHEVTVIYQERDYDNGLNKKNDQHTLFHTND
jgi:hypothetical protein